MLPPSEATRLKNSKKCLEILRSFVLSAGSLRASLKLKAFLKLKLLLSVSQLLCVQERLVY